jgi:hypothetical protein
MKVGWWFSLAWFVDEFVALELVVVWVPFVRGIESLVKMVSCLG